MDGLSQLPKAKQNEKKRKDRQYRYEVIKDYSNHNGWDIKWMCNQLKVSRAAYYKWMKREKTELELANEEVLKSIKEIAKSNNHLFGTMKMMYAVNKRMNTQYNHKRIYRLMCIHDLASSFRKTKRNKWKRSNPQVTAENRLNRNFEVSKPNEVWCTDVTEVAYPGVPTKAYISSYLDLYDRSVVGLSVSTRNDTALTNTSLFQAIEMNPGATPLHHSDRGFQYTREVFKNRLEKQGMKQSMSRVSRCIDNGPMEGFQGIFKEMLLILYPGLTTYEELEQAIYDTCEYYQNEYPQMRFKGFTPSEVRCKGLNNDSPTQYPITSNPRITRYWEHIEELKTKKNQVKENQLGLA